jgi:lipoprotein NlpD
MALGLHGCGTAGLAPVDSRDTSAAPAAPAGKSRAAASREGRHVVAPGDTLYAIAFRYGLDYRDLARWNSIEDPFVIIPGQSIRLSSPPAAAPRTAAGARRKTEPDRAAAQSRAPAPGATQVPAVAARLEWRWPATGRVHRSAAPTSRKGVDISGRQGQPIVAAAPGVVVYSGSGLLGYGRLIIIKHNDTYLSAYAYNERLLVQEGDRVAAAQEIATMGLGNDGHPVLHFQIRKDGKPVNPLDYLPKRSS